jgi:hypothetical protein
MDAMNKSTFFVAFGIGLILCPIAGHCQDDQTAYCQYVREQAMAQRDLLRAPSALTGPTQPDTGTPAEMVFGLTMSLVDVKRASLTMRSVHSSCELNAALTEAQQHIYYAKAIIERDVLLHRIDLIQAASIKLDGLAKEEGKLVEVHNLTRPAVYHLQAARERLDMSRASALTGIATPYVPALSDVPLRTLVLEKEGSELANEKDLTNLEKANGWDLKVAVGGRQRIGSQNTATNISSAGAFGEFTLTYNLGRRSANQHLDRSVAAYVAWKNDKFDDVTQQAEVLKQQLTESLAFHQQQLETLRGHRLNIMNSLSELEEVDTSSAIAFKNQLVADELVLEVDIDDLQFRIDRITSYLKANF